MALVSPFKLVELAQIWALGLELSILAFRDLFPRYVLSTPNSNPFRFIFGNAIGFGTWDRFGNSWEITYLLWGWDDLRFRSDWGNFFPRNICRALSKSYFAENGANNFKLGWSLILEWTCVLSVKNLLFFGLSPRVGCLDSFFLS